MPSPRQLVVLLSLGDAAGCGKLGQRRGRKRRRAEGHPQRRYGLEQVIADIRAGARERALVELDRLIDRHPNFRLAYLVRGDLLLARVRPIANLGNPLGSGGELLEDLRAEARARLRACALPYPKATGFRDIS